MSFLIQLLLKLPRDNAFVTQIHKQLCNHVGVIENYSSSRMWHAQHHQLISLCSPHNVTTLW